MSFDSVIDLLKRIAGPAPVARDDPVWQNLGGNVQHPLSTRDPRLLEAACAPFWNLLGGRRPHLAQLCASLASLGLRRSGESALLAVVNNEASGNFQLLIVSALGLLKDSSRLGVYGPASNAVCLLQSLFKYLTEKLGVQQLQAFCDPDPVIVDASPRGEAQREPVALFLQLRGLSLHGLTALPLQC